MTTAAHPLAARARAARSCRWRETRRAPAAAALRRTLVALALVGAPAGAEPYRLVGPFPAAPTWHDPVRVELEGEVSGGCGVAVGDPVATELGPLARRIEVPLWVDCTLPTGSFHPFSIPIELGRLAPGSVTVALANAGHPLVELDFHVFEVARIAVKAPPPSAHPSPSLTLVLLGDRTPALDLTVDSRLVQVVLGDAGAPRRLIELRVPLTGLAPGAYDVRVFAPADGGATAVARGAVHVLAPGSCVPDAGTLCLQGGRFRVTASWRAFDGRRGTARAAPLPGHQASGLLWFFAADNAELTVKVLDGCAVNGRWWVFLSSGSTVAYEVEVLDTATGSTRRYEKPLGEVPELVADTGAFPGCAAP